MCLKTYCEHHLLLSLAPHYSRHFDRGLFHGIAAVWNLKETCVYKPVYMKREVLIFKETTKETYTYIQNRAVIPKHAYILCPPRLLPPFRFTCTLRQYYIYMIHTYVNIYNTYTCKYIIGPPRLLVSFTRRWIRLSSRSRLIMAPMLKVCIHIYKHYFLHDMTHFKGMTHSWTWLRLRSIFAPMLNVCIHIFIFLFIRDMTHSYVCICICIAVYSWSWSFMCIYIYVFA